MRYKTSHLHSFFDSSKLKGRRLVLVTLAIAVFAFVLLASWFTGANLTGVTAQTSSQRDLRIVVISDLNSAYGSTTYEAEVHKALQLIPSFNPDLVLCSGDMVAGQSPKLSNAQIQAMWSAFD